MQRMVAAVTRWMDREAGQDLIEYAVIAALIAIVAILTIAELGGQVNSVLWVPIANAV